MEVAKSPTDRKESCESSQLVHAPDQLDVYEICHYFKKRILPFFSLFRHGRILPAISNESQYATATFATALKSHHPTRPQVFV